MLYYHMQAEKEEMIMNTKVKRLTLCGLFIAIGVALSTFSVPIGASRCFPIQHFVNVMAGMILGPLPALACAFCTSLIRLFMGTGTLLAFPGSMIGALLCGLAFKFTHKIWLGCLGEVFGTGLLGALCAYPISAFLMGREAAIFGLVIPFGISSLVGALAGSLIVYVLHRNHILDQFATLEQK